MATKTRGIINWIRYSGGSIIVRINPCHWNLWPQIEPQYNDTWAGPRQRTWAVTWLMITVRIWIDDGSW
jgi:hypothetical protein